MYVNTVAREIGGVRDRGDPCVTVHGGGGGKSKGMHTDRSSVKPDQSSGQPSVISAGEFDLWPASLSSANATHYTSCQSDPLCNPLCGDWCIGLNDFKKKLKL